MITQMVQQKQLHRTVQWFPSESISTQIQMNRSSQISHVRMTQTKMNQVSVHTVSHQTTATHNQTWISGGQTLIQCLNQFQVVSHPPIISKQEVLSASLLQKISLLVAFNMEVLYHNIPKRMTHVTVHLVNQRIAAIQNQIRISGHQIMNQLHSVRGHWVILIQTAISLVALSVCQTQNILNAQHYHQALIVSQTNNFWLFLNISNGV